jgi:nucleotide-binding universal stress UspA family protein
MEPIKEIIVGLDMSDLDLTLIEFAKVVARRDSVEKIHFYHRIKKQSIPEELRKEFPDMIDKYKEDCIGKIRARVEKVFDPNQHIALEYRVEEGNVATLVNMAIEAAVDLIIIGRKKSSGTGMLGQRLARRATCNILIVPEGSVPEVNKLLLPIDFSQYTKLALETAINVAENQPSPAEIICQNVYYVPVGYHYTGKSYDEVAKIMRSNAEKKFERFIQKIDTKGLKVSAVYSLDVNEDLSSDIYDLADEIKPDVIVIGAKGRTAAASLLLGSMAEKLITKYMSYPLLIVRPKGKSAGIIETFRDIE